MYCRLVCSEMQTIMQENNTRQKPHFQGFGFQDIVTSQITFWYLFRFSLLACCLSGLHCSSRSKVDIVPRVASTVVLLWASHRVNLLIIISPVVIGAGRPVVGVRQRVAVPVSASITRAASVAVPASGVPEPLPCQVVPAARPRACPH